MYGKRHPDNTILLKAFLTVDNERLLKIVLSLISTRGTHEESHMNVGEGLERGRTLRQ